MLRFYLYTAFIIKIGHQMLELCEIQNQIIVIIVLGKYRLAH